MKYLIFVLLFSLGLIHTAQADPSDTLEFTVIAPSGLSLRSAPSLDAKRLSIVPFGTSVETIGEWHEVFDEDLVEIIDQRQGYWIETHYQGQMGYLFSGYLKFGPLYLPSVDGINRDFRITIPGERCESINYDPALNWYGMYHDPSSGTIKVKTVKLQIQTGQHTIEDLDMAYAEIGDFLDVKAEEKDSFLLFFGTRTPINPNRIAHQQDYFNSHHINHWDQKGKFIYPYEHLPLYASETLPYYLASEEEVIVGDNAHGDEPIIDRRYHIYLTNQPNQRGGKNDPAVYLTKELGLEHSYAHFYYSGPRLLWKGDINLDGFPDVIFYTPYMSEGCGGSIGYQLLISEKVGEKFILKKVAAEYIGACYGC